MQTAPATGSVAAMMHRFRTASPTSRNFRNEQRAVGAVKEMWFVGDSNDNAGNTSMSAPDLRKSVNADEELLNSLQGSMNTKSSKAVNDSSGVGGLARSSRESADMSSLNMTEVPPEYDDSKDVISNVRTAPSVPRFRYLPKSSLVPIGKTDSPYGAGGGSSSESSSEGYNTDTDSDEDSESNYAWNRKRGTTRDPTDGGTRSSLQIATFRGDENDVRNKKSGKRRGRNKMDESFSSDSDSSQENLRASSSPRIVKILSKSLKPYKSSTQYSTLAITSDLEGVCETLNAKLNASGYTPYDNYTPSAHDLLGSNNDDLPESISQVTQNLQNDLWTFHKTWVEGHDGDKEQSEEKKEEVLQQLEDKIRGELQLEKAAAAAVPSLSPGKKSRKSRRKHRRHHSHNKNSLAPISTEIHHNATGGSLSPRARARALLGMISSTQTLTDSKDDDGIVEIDDDNVLTDEEERILDRRCDEASHDSEIDSRDKESNSDDYDDDDDTQDVVGNSYSSYNSQSFDDMYSSANIGSRRKSPKKNFYGRPQTQATSDDIVCDLDFAIKHMQSRLNISSPSKSLVILEGEEDGKKKVTGKEKKRKEEEEIDKMLDDAGERKVNAEEDGDDDDVQVSKKDQKRIRLLDSLIPTDKKKKDKKNRKGSADFSSDDGDSSVDSLDSSVFGGTQFGWIPNADNILQLNNVPGGTDVPEDQGVADVAGEKDNEDGEDGEDGNDGQDVSEIPPQATSGKTSDTADKKVTLPEPSAYTFLSAMKPSNNVPHITQNDAVYSGQYRPSTHENQNVTTPVIFVSNTPPRSRRNRKDNGNGVKPSAPPLNLPSTEVQSWSYVPRSSNEWVLRAHPSNNDEFNHHRAKTFNDTVLSTWDDAESTSPRSPRSPRFNKHGLDSFPSTHLDKYLQKGSSGEDSENITDSSRWNGASLKSARKRLEKFRKVREKISDNVWYEEGPMGTQGAIEKGEEERILREIKDSGNRRKKNSVQEEGEEEEGEEEDIVMAKNRLQAFKKLRGEFANLSKR